LEEKNNELAAQIEEAGAIMAQIKQSISQQKDYYAQLEQQADRLEQDIQSKVEQFEAEQALEEASLVKGTGDFIWPSNDSDVLTDFYGWREVHPVYGTARMHGGIDIGASYGSDVLAADGGTVMEVSYDADGYGNNEMISHGNRMSTLYAHMSEVNVEQGQTVSRGDVIGLVGMTGGVSGPHLHFEVWIGNSRTDPLDFFTDYSY
ncbi:MAG: M23 family metallopeptidase, partial [Oscillospiraceae bacterium]|nr:M23 family metallopeptidase [Oscillospiraceae bacterium]